MIQEIEIPSNDPLITHFKKLFEMNSFAEDRQNVVKIIQNKGWFSWCKSDIVDTELPIYINQIKDIMKNFKYTTLIKIIFETSIMVIILQSLKRLLRYIYIK